MPYVLSDKDYRRIQDALRKIERLTNPPSYRRHRPQAIGGGSGTQVRRAKIQTSGVGTTTLSCKLLDSAGTETGDVITVYPVEHLGTNNLSGNVWPKLAAADIVSIFQDVNDTWYTTFTFDDTDAC